MRRQTKITTDSLGCRRETARRRVPVEILFTADELYKEYVPKIIVNNKINLFFKTAIGILVKKISNYNSFRALFDKTASVYFV